MSLESRSIDVRRRRELESDQRHLVGEYASERSLLCARPRTSSTVPCVETNGYRSTSASTDWVSDLVCTTMQDDQQVVPCVRLLDLAYNNVRTSSRGEAMSTVA